MATGTVKSLMRERFVVLTQTSPLHTSLCKLINQLVTAKIWSRTSLVIGACRLRERSCFWKKLLMLMVVVQTTHTFDVNGCDALLHSAQKRKLRNYRAPLCTDHIVRDWILACDEVCHGTIQWCFMRTLRRNTEGNIDESLVPQSIQDWWW